MTKQKLKRGNEIEMELRILKQHYDNWNNAVKAHWPLIKVITSKEMDVMCRSDSLTSFN